MKYRLLSLLALGFLLTVFLKLDVSRSQAETTTVDVAKYQELTLKIQEYERILDVLNTTDKSLKTDLARIDNQMLLTQTKIAQAKTDIKRKEEELVLIGQDISTLQIKISRLADAVERQQETFDNRLQAQYKRSTINPIFELFLSSRSFSEAISEIKYLKIAELNDQRLIIQMNNSREDYKDQTALLEQKKSDALTVKAQIEAEQQRLTNLENDLVAESEQKKQLLIDTQNDEAKYQQLLAQAKAEQAAISQIFAGADFTNAKDVKAGDVIAVMGNTGAPSCSTGAHLHFEVHKDGVLQNAEDYLKNETLPFTDSPDSSTVNIGNGDWDWPMKSPIVTQRFGKTPHSYWYSGGVHTGIDMISNESYLIYTPTDGKMIKKSGTCGSSTYNYVLIRHSDGVESLYLHVQ